MKDLKNTTQLVKAILEESERARNDDNYLYLCICDKINPYISGGKSFRSVLLTGKCYGLPGFETVRRARQKLQQKYPELRGSERVQRKRAEREQEFREYARSEV